VTETIWHADADGGEHSAFPMAFSMAA